MCTTPVAVNKDVVSTGINVQITAKLIFNKIITINAR